MEPTSRPRVWSEPRVLGTAEVADSPPSLLSHLGRWVSAAPVNIYTHTYIHGCTKHLLNLIDRHPRWLATSLLPPRLVSSPSPPFTTLLVTEVNNYFRGKVFSESLTHFQAAAIPMLLPWADRPTLTASPTRTEPSAVRLPNFSPMIDIRAMETNRLVYVCMYVCRCRRH